MGPSISHSPQSHRIHNLQHRTHTYLPEWRHNICQHTRFKSISANTWNFLHQLRWREVIQSRSCKYSIGIFQAANIQHTEIQELKDNRCLVSLKEKHFSRWNSIWRKSVLPLLFVQISAVDIVAALPHTDHLNTQLAGKCLATIQLSVDLSSN